MRLAERKAFLAYDAENLLFPCGEALFQYLCGAKIFTLFCRAEKLCFSDSIL